MSRRDARRYLVAYDVPDDARRDRLAKKLQAFGDRIQYSVFVVDAASVRRQRMEHVVRSVMVESEDSVVIADLGPVERGVSAGMVVLGRDRPLTDPTSFVL